MTARRVAARSRLVVALDVGTAREARRLVDRLLPVVTHFKVGSVLSTAMGPAAVELVQQRGGRVFLDLKFHDIPNTVGQAVAAATRQGVWMVNVHAQGGREMMVAAARAARETARALRRRRPLVVGVTLLTSLGGDALRKELGVGRSVEDQVVHLARLALSAGLDGVVASPREVASLRAALGPAAVIVTPGIRHERVAGDDQRRTLTARAALDCGADYLVVGRPIIADPDPRAAAERMLASLK